MGLNSHPLSPTEKKCPEQLRLGRARQVGNTTEHHLKKQQLGQIMHQFNRVLSDQIRNAAATQLRVNVGQGTPFLSST